ncbi:hypothetical protein VTO73DRAFT_4560 [Trametes versicolor]
MFDKKIIQYEMNCGQSRKQTTSNLGPVNSIALMDEIGGLSTHPHMHSMPAVTLHPSKKYSAAHSMNNQILVYRTDNFR